MLYMNYILYVSPSADRGNWGLRIAANAGDIIVIVLLTLMIV